MSLAVRIIPTLLFRGDQLVKGQRFDSWRSVGSVVQAAKIYGHRGADEIILLDIDATKEGRGPNLKVVEKIANDFFTPLTVGGGVRSVDDVRDLLNAGADKVACCTAFIEEPSFVRRCADKFGSQAIVVAIDYKNGYCYSRSGTSEHGGSAVAWAVTAVREGAGEILLTCIYREGTMQGYDLDTLNAVSERVDIPVIANGGCSGPEDMLAAINAGASAVAAGALFQFTDHTPKSCAQYLHERGIEVRV